jgi:cell division septation protein DedD
VIEKEKPSTTSTTANTTAPKAKKEPKANTSTASSAPAVITNPGATNNNQQLYYSVQICALKRAVDVSYFEKNHSVTQKIYVQMHEGWHKYTVGEFAVYKEARDHRETVKTNNKIVGPFVTAYNKGVRITVQEALMISGQQWVQ